MRRLLMALLLIYLVIKAQLPIHNKHCPAGIAKRVREISDDYLNTFWEHKRLLEERENIKKKYEKEIKDIKDKTYRTIDKLTRQNAKLAGMVNQNHDYDIDCLWYKYMVKDPTLQKGVYELSVDGLIFPASCGRGTTLIFRNERGLNMNRTWQEYKEGFGDVKGDHWLGNEKIYKLTKKRTRKLLSLQPDNFDTMNGFRISSERNKYAISGTAWLNGKAFSTYDRDNDMTKEENCAALRGRGGWFDESCSSSLTKVTALILIEE